MNRHDRRLAYLSATMGLVSTLMGVLIVILYPIDATLPEGFRTPMIAFEFARIPDDLLYLTGNGSREQHSRENMTSFLHWDMAFLLAYVGFMLLILVRAVPLAKRLGQLGALCTLLILPLDLNENLTLLDITHALEGEGSNLQVFLDQLHTDTWRKWWAIFATLTILTVALINSRELWSAALSGASALGILVCWVSGSAPLFAELMGTILLLFFLLFTVKECRHAYCVMRSCRVYPLVNKNDDHSNPE